MSATLLKNADFKLINEFVKPDSKKRLTLGAIVEGGVFNVYRNGLGQIVLDPVKAIPASEAWLFENTAALDAVKRGLRESAAGKVSYLGSFAKHAK